MNSWGDDHRPVGLQMVMSTSPAAKASAPETKVLRMDRQGCSNSCADGVVLFSSFAFLLWRLFYLSHLLKTPNTRNWFRNGFRVLQQDCQSSSEPVPQATKTKKHVKLTKPKPRNWFGMDSRQAIPNWFRLLMSILSDYPTSTCRSKTACANTHARANTHGHTSTHSTIPNTWTWRVWAANCCRPPLSKTQKIVNN